MHEQEAREVFDLMHRHVSPVLAFGAELFGQGALEAEAEGALVRLSDGREVIDFGSYGLTMLGHRNAAVLSAVSDQMERMTVTTRLLASEVVARFTAELAERVGGSLDGVWLGSDGADVVEAAVKLARKASGKHRVLAVRGGFHGKTLGALALTWDPDSRAGLEPLLAGVTHLDPADPAAVLTEVAAGDVAALIVEPIQGESGVRPLDREIWRRWADDAKDAGAYVISDEIQVGLRRCGPISMALETGIPTDALLLGKALGGGVMPLSALLATPDLHRPIAESPTWHGSTFQLQPLSCAAGRASLRAVDELAPQGERLGRRLDQALDSLAREHEGLVKEVRGAGLLRGVEFASAEAGGITMLGLVQRGLIVSPCLSSPETIRLLVPMVTTDDQLERAFEIFSETLAAAAAVEPAPAG
jgi:putrescine aminotransferase